MGSSSSTTRIRDFAMILRARSSIARSAEALWRQRITPGPTKGRPPDVWSGKRVAPFGEKGGTFSGGLGGRTSRVAPFGAGASGSLEKGVAPLRNGTFGALEKRVAPFGGGGRRKGQHLSRRREKGGTFLDEGWGLWRGGVASEPGPPRGLRTISRTDSPSTSRPRRAPRRPGVSRSALLAQLGLPSPTLRPASSRARRRAG